MSIPVHYGIVVIAAMGIAFFLPPVGVGLTIAAGIGRVDIDDVSRDLRAVSGRIADRSGTDRRISGITLILPRLLLGYGR